MTNAGYQRTRPMTNGRAPEQPHYAVITEDGWPGAPTPPPPTRAGNGSRSGSARRGGSRAAAARCQSRPAGGDARARSRETTRPPAAEEQSSALSGRRGRVGRPACQDTQLCTHMAGTRASRLCPCTVHLRLLSRHNPNLAGPGTQASFTALRRLMSVT